MGFANVRAGYQVPARTLANPIARHVLEYSFVLRPQDIDQEAIMRPLCKYCRTVKSVRDVVPALREAFAAAMSGVTGPVCVAGSSPVKIVRAWCRIMVPGTPKSGIYNSSLRSCFFNRGCGAALLWARYVGLPIDVLYSISEFKAGLGLTERRRARQRIPGLFSQRKAPRTMRVF